MKSLYYNSMHINVKFLVLGECCKKEASFIALVL